MKDGMNGTMKLLGWVGGVVSLLITIYVVFHAPLSCAITQETQCRSQEDASIRKDLTMAMLEQKTMNQEITSSLVEIKTDVKWLKKARHE